MQPRIVRAVGLALAFALACVGCGKKKNDAPPPEITGLSAVPASAEVVIAVDVEKISASPIVARAFEQLLLRDAQLAQSWEHVRDACKPAPHRDVQSPEEKTGETGEENARQRIVAVPRSRTARPLGERPDERAATSTKR